MQDRQYYAVFTPPARTHWWSWFLNRRIGHCLAVIVDGPDAVVLERHCHSMEVLHYRDHSIEDILSALRTVTPLIALHVARPPDLLSKVRYYGPFYCVTLVKAVLGISAWAMTPHQLYKHLLKNHSTSEVFPNDKYNRPEGT